MIELADKRMRCGCNACGDGLAHSRPIVGIWPKLKNATAKDRFRVEVEAVVNRFFRVWLLRR